MKSVVLLKSLFAMDAESTPDVKQLLDKFSVSGKGSFAGNNVSGKKTKGRTDKFTVLKREKTVDLHIEELVKDPSELNQSQILSLQIRHFIYELEQALIQQYHKITFIHGVGQGILKNAIREELKKYPELKWEEAPPEKFGFGATVIELI